MEKSVAKILEYIKKNNKIALFHHSNIDGDSFSSSYGLALALKKAFPEKEVKWVVNEEEMNKNFPFLEYDRSYVIDDIDESWLAIVGDTSSKSKLDHLEIIEKASQVVVFDHHRNDIEIKHDFFWHEPEWPASAMQAIEIAKATNVEFDESIAFALIIGLLTDTGNFTYSLANPLPVKMYGELLKYISDEKMNKFWNSFRSRSVEDIEVTKLLLNNIKYDGKVAYVFIDKKLATELGDQNYKLKISQIANIKNYPIWCLFVEDAEENVLKLHFRSNGPDVSKLAIKLGGGGHLRAAGAKIKNQPDAIKNILVALNKVAK